MPELRRSLHVLVEHPPAPPVSVEVVAARGARFRRRRRILRGAVGLAIAAVASGVGLGVALQDTESSVMLATAGPGSAGYVAERPGGYVAAGTWRLTITRGEEVIDLSSTTSGPCGTTGVILPGDEVRGFISGPDSMLRVGDRFSCPG